MTLIMDISFCSNIMENIKDIYDRYIIGANKVKDSIDDMRLNQCILFDCNESALPTIDRVLVVGCTYIDNDNNDKTSDVIYWIFDNDAFYWASSMGLPILYKDGHMYITPNLDQINKLIESKLHNQYVVIVGI